MAGEGTKRIIDLTEAAETQNGDYFAIDSTGRGTRKLPAGSMATAEDLSAEETARQTADATLDGKITAETQARLAADNSIGEQITALDEKTEADAALIQNPTETLSGALCSFTDGANMPMVACSAEIVPKQSGTGTPSPDNVRPISGWESVNVDVTGKNLLATPYNDGSKTNNGITWTVNDDGTVTANGTATADSYFYFRYNDGYLPYSSYYVSGCPSGGSGSTYYIQFASWGGLSMAEDTGNGGTFIHDERDARINNKLRVIAYIKSGTTVNNLVFKPMITKGAYGYDDYTPYIAPNTTTTALGRTVYGGEAEIVGGSLTDKMGIVDLGTLTWTVSTNDRFYAAMPSGAITPTSSGDTEAICSHYDRFLAESVSINSQPDGTFFVNSTKFSSVKRVVIKDSSKSSMSAADFKTAMSGVQLVYELATPQTYTLTPTQINTLLGENNVWADSGDVEITYRRDISIVINNLESALNG